MVGPQRRPHQTRLPPTALSGLLGHRPGRRTGGSQHIANWRHSRSSHTTSSAGCSRPRVATAYRPLARSSNETREVEPVHDSTGTECLLAEKFGCDGVQRLTTMSNPVQAGATVLSAEPKSATSGW